MGGERLVLDASITLSWFLPDERDERADEVLEFLSSSHAVVPAIWPLEVADVLWQAERRHRVSREHADEFLMTISHLKVRVDEQAASTGLAFGKVIGMAREHGLTPYDATYLELAERCSLPLLTLDRKLIAAAEALSISTELPDADVGE